MAKPKVIVRWGALWSDRNSTHLLCRDCMPVLFHTRTQARVWIKDQYGYILGRKDLLTAPHWWRLPKAIRVVIAAKQVN
jgi:hypothetical protein